MIKCLAVVVSAVALLSSAAALAGEPQVVSHKTVSYADLNLNSDQDIAALQGRIVAAADEVCSAEADKTNPGNFEYSNCKNTAVRNAIAAVSRNVSRRLASMQ